MILDVVKILLPAIMAFLVGIAIAPYITDFLYKKEMWRRNGKTSGLGGGETPIFNEKLDKEKLTKTPRLGGSVIWISAIIVALLFWILNRWFGIETFEKLEFISRNQTWIPFTTLLIGAFTGLIDDLMTIKGSRHHKAGGMSLITRISIVGIIGILIGSWFYLKLDVYTIGVPFFGEMFVGWLLVPIYALILIATYSGGIIDGIDGLAGGIFATMFGAYGVIAFSLNQIDLAAFCALMVGGIFAFLWFNIPPARFYMSETGSMALTITLGVVAFMTDALVGGTGILILPIVALPLVVTTLSVIIQVLSKKYLGKKILQVAPLHHHFEAIGWPAYKVTMRYWVFSIIVASLGMILALIG